MASNPDGSHYDARTITKPRKTGAQRQTEYRQRLAARNRIELRGVYAHPDDHAKIRAFAHSLQNARQDAATPDPRQPSSPL